MKTAADLIIDVDGSEPRVGSDVLRRGESIVVGTPLHCDASSLVDDFESSTTEDFLDDEARFSGGDYVIVHRGTDDTVEIVTSLGYSGGYISDHGERTRISTSLADTLEGKAYNDVRFDENYLTANHRTNLSYVPPYSTPFRGVKRVPPGYLLRFEEGLLSHRRGYLHRSAQIDGPDNVGQALSESMELLAEEDLTIAFSGGIDCTSLFLALREHVPESDIRLITFNTGTVHGGATTRRALSLADSLDVDTELLDFDDRSTLISHYETALRKDFYNIRSPYAMLDSTNISEGEVIISGQNTGEIVAHDMVHPQYSFAQRRAGRSLGEKLLVTGRDALKFTVPNFQFTDSYLNRRTVREIFGRTMPTLYRLIEKQFPERVPEVLPLEGKFDASEESILTGFVSSRHPSFHATEDRDSFEDTIRQDVEQFSAETQSADQRSAFDQFYYYHLMHNASRVRKYPLENDGKVNYPVMSGPAAAYFVGKRRNLRECLSAKRELYQYFRDQVGESYFDLAEPNVEIKEPTDLSNSVYVELFEDHIDRFEPGESLVFERISGTGTKRSLESTYADARTRIEQKDFSNLAEVASVERILNLELLLEDNFDV